MLISSWNTHSALSLYLGRRRSDMIFCCSHFFFPRGLCVGSWFTEWKASKWWRNINAGRYRWAKQPPASSVTCGVCFHCQKEAVPNSYQPAERLKVIQEKKVRNPHCTPPTQRRVRLQKHDVYVHHLQHFCVQPFVLLHQCKKKEEEIMVKMISLHIVYGFVCVCSFNVHKPSLFPKMIHHQGVRIFWNKLSRII